MSFASPLLLVGLVAVPILLAAYLWQLRRRRTSAVRYSNVALVRLAAGPSRRWRRHVPIAVVLASLALLGLASARPQVRLDVPVSSSAVILALDVSGSMCSTDVSPNRLSAAQSAVRKFIENQDDQTKVGLVLFSGFAQLAVAPTTNKADLLATLDAVTTGRGTTIGAAILKSVDAISELDPNVAPSDPGDAPNPDGTSLVKSPTETPATPTPTPAKSASGDKAPEIVVLLTDGANTRGISPQAAAEQAAARGVRVYPIGFGTTNPTQMVCSRSQVGGLEQQFRGPNPGGAGGGGVSLRSFLVVDEDALRTVASTTGGEYFAAKDADQLNSVLSDLPKHIQLQEQDVDISFGFTAVAAVLLLLGLGLSIRWSTLSG
ncbi:VWA domain-containing protein [Lapillicoccus sp.]|uniref:VWA domain-containing protein n=1 Tax=Lapillicoccus sp. TaxID=1909287 RepID=UPI0027BCF474|nr:VWA domain-containing protein [Actinomycetota bacterium]